MIALFIVFAIVWAGFFLYVFYMSRKSQNLMREIDILKPKLEIEIQKIRFFRWAKIGRRNF
ncbi:MAG: hypothetical protein CM1200mP38_4480 [Dehalococcoidia bacterium]|nr:MAG: hypothetical protein CM1200mP38_4480 [Dehalococcoidia bacterium]